MFVCTVYFLDAAGKSRQTMIIRDNLDDVYVALSKVRKHIESINCSFAGSVVENIDENFNLEEQYEPEHTWH